MIRYAKKTLIKIFIKLSYHEFLNSKLAYFSLLSTLERELVPPKYPQNAPKQKTAN